MQCASSWVFPAAAMALPPIYFSRSAPRLPTSSIHPPLCASHLLLLVFLPFILFCLSAVVYSHQIAVTEQHSGAQPTLAASCCCGGCGGCGDDDDGRCCCFKLLLLLQAAAAAAAKLPAMAQAMVSPTGSVAFGWMKFQTFLLSSIPLASDMPQSRRRAHRLRTAPS